MCISSIAVVMPFAFVFFLSFEIGVFSHWQCLNTFGVKQGNDGCFLTECFEGLFEKCFEFMPDPEYDLGLRECFRI